MKKYFLCLIVALMISGCAAPAFEPPVAAELEDLPEPVTEWTVTDGITIRLMNKEFPVGVEQNGKAPVMPFLQPRPKAGVIVVVPRNRQYAVSGLQV